MRDGTGGTGRIGAFLYPVPEAGSMEAPAVSGGRILRRA
jgi:hypothetical protein